MAHKTLIDGTAYEIGGGKTLVNGTAYEIDKGKTLVNGTAYEVGWIRYYYISLYGCYIEADAPNDNSNVGFDDTCAYATINGVKYTSRSVNIPILAGTQISLKVSASHSDQTYRCHVKMNGTVVQDGGGTYYFTPTKDCMIAFVEHDTIANWTYINYFTAEITM